MPANPAFQCDGYALPGFFLCLYLAAGMKPQNPNP